MSSNIIVDRLKAGDKVVTVPEIFDKVHEVSPTLTSINSTTPGKSVTIDQLHAKVNESDLEVKNLAFTAVKGKRYMITANVQATLPLGSTLTKGDCIRFAKTVANTPTVKCAGSDTVVMNGKSGDGITFDTNVEFIIVWNGTTWEV